MSRFNLIDEEWIPVQYLNRARGELGIRDTLLRAKEIAAIEDQSPLIVAALHRLLLAVLYRALEGPAAIDEAKELFSQGLPDKKIEAYLEKWWHRFWLFDETHPFYQVPYYKPEKNKEWKSWPAIAAEHNAENAKVLFDHVDTANAGQIPSRMAARWLVACQTFALGGGRSDFLYTKNSPAATGVKVLPLGVNLHDTLLFSLVPENREVLAEDRPVWEREPLERPQLKGGVSRQVQGYADLYTWLTRSINFNLDENGGTLGKLVLASGVECSSEEDIENDPMQGYEIDETRGRVLIKFQERGLWRVFDSLLPSRGESGRTPSPRVMEHALALSRLAPERFPQSVMVLGQKNEKAKIECWRMERFALPKALQGDRCIREEIRQLLLIASQTEKVLEDALKIAARFTVAKGERKLEKDKWSNGKWRPGDISKFIGKSTFESAPPVLANYWSILEARFHEVLCEYTLDRNEDDIRCQWLKSIWNALQKTWGQYSAISMCNAWAIRALVKAEGAVNRKLQELQNEIRQLEPGKGEI